MEGIDVCWAEEAEAISDMSWDVLVPTIRKSGSEIWISFNPKFDDDATYVRFVSNPPANCIAIKMNWTDNKYISQELLDEKDDLKERDLDTVSYTHLTLPTNSVWCRSRWSPYH